MVVKRGRRAKKPAKKVEVEEEEEEDNRKGGKRGKKGGKKKKRGGRADSDSEDDAPVPSASKKGAKSKKPATSSKASGNPINLIRVIDEVKRAIPDGDDDELVTNIAREILPALKDVYTKRQQEIFSGGAGDRRKKHEHMCAVIQELYSYICIYNSSIRSLLPDSYFQEEEEDEEEQPTKKNQGKREKGARKEKNSSSSKKEQTHSEFAGTVSEGVLQLVEKLQKHLLKTLCSQATDFLIRNAGMHAGFTFSDDEEKKGDPRAATPSPSTVVTSSYSFSVSSAIEDSKGLSINRNPILQQDKEDVLVFLGKGKRGNSSIKALINNLTGKDLSQWLARFEKESRVGEIWLRPADKKKERSLVFSIRKELMTQLQIEQNPTLVLYYAVLVLYSKAESTVVHAPIHCISSILSMLQETLTDEAYEELEKYNDIHNKHIHSQSQAEDGVLIGKEGEDEEEESGEELQKALEDGKESIRKMGLNPKDAVKTNSDK